MIRWCRAHFGEAFSAWMHVKLVKSYVESVMRYGLPVDFSAFVLETKKGQEPKVSRWVFLALCLSEFVGVLPGSSFHLAVFLVHQAVAA